MLCINIFNMKSMMADDTINCLKLKTHRSPFTARFSLLLYYRFQVLSVGISLLAIVGFHQPPLVARFADKGYYFAFCSFTYYGLIGSWSFADVQVAFFGDYAYLTAFGYSCIYIQYQITG